MTTNTPANIHHSTDPKKYISDYWRERADDFAKLRREELSSNKYLLWQQEISAHLPIGKSLRILDIGCGAGFFSILLAQMGHTVTGIDITPAMIADAKILSQSCHCSISFEVMDAEQLTFAAASFDVVIARNVTWNLPDPQLAYSEWLRVLRPCGLLMNYDAEYARDHHRPLPARNAHASVSSELLERCHNIYHMLDISVCDRPAWDEAALLKAGARSVSVDRSVGSRIYPQEDDFYIPAPMFGIFATK